MKTGLRVAGVVLAFAALVSAAAPAHAFTPTISEVRSLNGPDPGGDFDDLALTSDAATAVVVSDGQAWVVDVATNTPTEITGLSDPYLVVLDETGTFAYITESTGSFGSYAYQVSKVDVASATIVDTWADPALTFGATFIFLSADASDIYLVGSPGSHPNRSIGVAKLNLASGAITQYVWGDGDPGYFAVQPGFDTVSGKLMVPYRDTATGQVSGFAVFDTASNTFTDAPWAGSGTLYGCDSQAGVVACYVNDTVPYLATVNASGSAIATLNVDSAVSSFASLTLIPDGTQAYVYGDGGDLANVEIIDLTSMASLMILNTSLDYANVVRMAPDAGQIWLTSDYNADYDGGYQVVQFAPPVLPNTGSDVMFIASVSGFGTLLLAAGTVLLVTTRRRIAQG